MNLSELCAFHHKVTDLQERVLRGAIHPDTAREQIAKLKEEWWQQLHNVVDLMVALAKEAGQNEED